MGLRIIGCHRAVSCSISLVSVKNVYPVDVYILIYQRCVESEERSGSKGVMLVRSKSVICPALHCTMSRPDTSSCSVGYVISVFLVVDLSL